jgi:hypothetical protein
MALETAVNLSDSASDFEYPAPGAPGYDEFRKTGKLPSHVEDSAPPKKEVAAPEVTEEIEAPESLEEEADSAPAEVVTRAESAPAKPQKKTGEQRKSELNAEIRELIRKRDALLAPAPSVTAAPQPAAEKPVKADEGKPEPALDDKGKDGKPLYATFADYQKAWTKWVRGEVVREARAAATEHTTASQKQMEAAQADRIIVETFNKRAVEPGRKKYPDFDAVALNPKLPILKGSTIEAYILDSDHGADVAYYLGQHPEELTRLSGFISEVDGQGNFVRIAPGLTPLQQARELSMIEYRLTQTTPVAPVKPPAKVVSQAPAPPHRVTGKGPAPDALEQSVKDGDQRAYTERMNAIELERFRARNGRKK